MVAGMEPRPIAPALRDVYSVSRLNREAKALLETGFPLLWLEGEISNLSRPASGHLYFCLKDAQSQIRCALFRSQASRINIPLRDGMGVVVRARVSLYEGRGEFQLLVDQIEDSGEGALRRAFDALKRRLHDEGLFAAARKRALPTLPRRIGIITSPTGAAVRDILTTLRRRFPAIAVLLYPVPVQGADAAERIARAIALASARNECDALILARGGGSLEDLWPFNEEIVARALAACRLPVVAGIGHETDFTIADWVADVRAPTPTAAAEILSPLQQAWLQVLAQHETRLCKLMQRRQQEAAQRLDWTQRRLVHPRAHLTNLGARFAAAAARLQRCIGERRRHHRQRLATASLRLHTHALQRRLVALRLRVREADNRLRWAAQREVGSHAQRLKLSAQALGTLSPLATLSRGYALVHEQATGAIVRAASAVRPGTALSVDLAQGRLECVVTATQHDKTNPSDASNKGPDDPRPASV